MARDDNFSATIATGEEDRTVYYVTWCLEDSQPMVFTTMDLSQGFRGLVSRFACRSVFWMSTLSNPLLLMVPLVVGMQLARVGLSLRREALLLVPLLGPDRTVSATISALLPVAVELEKLFLRRSLQVRAGALRC